MPTVGSTRINPTTGQMSYTTTDNTGVSATSATASALTIPNLTLTGDVTGSGPSNGTISLAIEPTGVQPGTYQGLVVNTKGQIVAASAITIGLPASGVVAGTYNSVVVTAQGLIVAGTTVTPSLSQTSVVTGDVTGTGSTAIVLTLAATGVTAGTYQGLVVNAKGQVTAATSIALATNTSIQAALSGFTVNAAIGGATTTPAALQDRFGDLANVVRDFGATVGGTDASTAFNNALTAVFNRGGGTVLVPNLGSPYMISKPIIPLAGVKLVGIGNPVIKLLPSANCALVESARFQFLAGTGSNTGPIFCEIEGIVLDGNAPSQAALTPVFQNGISFYGAGLKLRKVRVQNVIGHGLRLEWATSAATSVNNTSSIIENILDDIVVFNSGRHGVWVKGPTETTIRDVITHNSSQVNNATYNGFQFSNNGTLRGINLHAYNDATGNQMGYGMATAGVSEFTNCYFERAQQAVLITGPGAHFSNCQFFNPPSTTTGLALVDLRGNNCYFVGCGFALVAPANSTTVGQPYYGLSIGMGGTPVTGTVVTGCTFTEFDRYGPFNFVTDGGNTVIEATGATTNLTGTTVFGGAYLESSSVDYRQTGTTFAVQSNLFIGDLTRATNNGVKLIAGNTGGPSGVQAVGHDTNVGLFLSTKGSGALIGDVPDNTLNGGNVRGAYAVDWQLARTLATQVVSSTGGTIGGGLQNTVTGNYSVIPGGFSNIADAAYATAGGIGAHTHNRYGSQVWSGAYINTPGDNQYGNLSLYARTTNATATRATADGLAAFAYNSIGLPPYCCATLRFRAIARDTPSTSCVTFTTPAILFTIGATVSTVQMSTGNTVVSTVAMTVENSIPHGGGALSAATISVAPDNTSGAVAVTVTGVTGSTIYWQVFVEFLEVIAPS